MNLLKIRFIRSLLYWRWFPIAPQLIMLVALALLIVGGVGVTTNDPAFAKVLRNTNLANLIVWSYWWPLIIIAAIFLGRLWCIVCPIELVTYLLGRIGLRRPVPRFFKTGWVITIFYMLILIVGIHTLAIHRIPQRMALFLLVLLLVAIAISLVYKKRAFCSYICPVGHLLGLYALISPLEWRANDQSVCKDCKTKDCFVKKNHYRLFGRSCTSNLYPATIKNNQDCLLCTQCLKACPYDNLRFSIRKPFADFLGTIKLRPAQVGFVGLVSGFVVYEILSEWAVSKEILMWIPNQLTNALRITGTTASFVSALVMFIIFPGILFLVVGTLAKIISRISIRDTFQVLALLLLPTMASAHALKAILKMTSRIPYWSYSLSDPIGVITAGKIVGKTLKLNESLSGALYPVISYFSIGIFVTGLIATVLVFVKSAAIRKIAPGARFILILGVLAYWSVFTLTILRWRF